MKKLTLILSLLFISVFSNAQIQIDSVIVTDVQCSGGCDGSITVFTSGGTGTETFNIGGTPQTSNIFTGLCAATFNVTVTDAVSNFVYSNINISEPTPLVVITNNISSTCGNSNGSASVIVAGGTPPYSYLWNDVNSTTTDDLLNISAGNYSLTVSDDNGCFAIQNTTITDLPIPTIDSIVTTNISCYGFSDGTAEVFASGSTTLSYSWDDPMNQTGQTAINLVASLPLYSVIVTDNNGCSTSTGNIQLTEPAPLSANINAPDTVCFGVEIQLFGNANGGTLPYASYDWSGEINTTGQGPIIDTLTSSSNYNLMVTDNNGCATSVSHTVNVDFCTSVTEAKDKKISNIYPNPTTGIINIKSGHNIIKYPLAIDIVNLKGEIVQNSILNSKNSTIDISNLTKGVYILNNKENSFHQRVILE
jgi:hypothetical protein